MNDTVGEVRPRQGPALRALHGPLRLRAVGRARRQREVDRTRSRCWRGNSRDRRLAMNVAPTPSFLRWNAKPSHFFLGVDRFIDSRPRLTVRNSSIRRVSRCRRRHGHRLRSRVARDRLAARRVLAATSNRGRASPGAGPRSPCGRRSRRLQSRRTEDQRWRTAYPGGIG